MSSEFVALPIEKEFDDLLNSFSTSTTDIDQPAILTSFFILLLKDFMKEELKVLWGITKI